MLQQLRPSINTSSSAILTDFCSLDAFGSFPHIDCTPLSRPINFGDHYLRTLILILDAPVCASRLTAGTVFVFPADARAAEA